MRIGVAAPCHIEDKAFADPFRKCLDALRPQPDADIIVFHNGIEGLGAARSKGFNYLFDEMGCDVVLNASIDHHLLLDILAHVRGDQITGFGYVVKKPATDISILRRAFSPYAWTGVYSLTRKNWMDFKASPWYENWDGEGDSLQWWALENRKPIKRVKMPKYWILRYSLRMKEHAVELGGRRAVLKLMDAW